jgi:hypothetical protein
MALKGVPSIIALEASSFLRLYGPNRGINIIATPSVTTTVRTSATHAAAIWRVTEFPIDFMRPASNQHSTITANGTVPQNKMAINRLFRSPPDTMPRDNITMNWPMSAMAHAEPFREITICRNCHLCRNGHGRSLDSEG